jgi:hypothetical protein
MLQVWHHLLAARVIHQFVGEEGADAWWIEVEGPMKESNKFQMFQNW